MSKRSPITRQCSIKSHPSDLPLPPTNPQIVRCMGFSSIRPNSTSVRLWSFCQGTGFPLFLQGFVSSLRPLGALASEDDSAATGQLEWCGFFLAVLGINLTGETDLETCSIYIFFNDVQNFWCDPRPSAAPN